MYLKDIIDVIEDLNQDLPEELYEDGIIYDYSTTGYVDIVNFANNIIYHSEINGEEEIEDAGGFKEFLIQERNKFIDKLNTIRSK